MQFLIQRFNGNRVGEAVLPAERLLEERAEDVNLKLSVSLYPFVLIGMGNVCNKLKADWGIAFLP